MSSLFDETEGKEVMKSGFVLNLIDGWHCWNAVQMMQKEGGHLWTEGPLCMNLIMCRDRGEVLQAVSIEPSKLGSTSTATLSKVTTFAGVMKELVIYAVAFWLQ